MLQELGTHAGRVLAVLDQLDARDWVSKGASETYVDQLDSSKQQARALGDEAETLSRSPEKLSGSLQLFFRLEGLQNMINSLQEGARKYQGPQVAQALAAAYAEGGANRERFRSYIINLAAEREHHPKRPQEGTSSRHDVHLQFLWRGIHAYLHPLHQRRLRQSSVREVLPV